MGPLNHTLPALPLDIFAAQRLRYARRTVAADNVARAQIEDAAIFRRLVSTRLSDKRARAYPDQPGVFE